MFMIQNKGLTIGIVGGVVAAIVVIALFATGVVKLPGRFSIENLEGERTSQGLVAVPGTSAITEEGEVLAPSGAAAQNNSIPGAPDAPQQSDPVALEALPEQSVKISVSSAGFAPSSFTVKAGAPITLAVTSVDSQTHVFLFDAADLSAVAIGVGPQETRALSFKAPSAKGEYTFHCDVPGHAARGEVGKMIVE